MKTYSYNLFEKIKKLKILKDFFESFYDITGISIDILDKNGKSYQVCDNLPIFCKIIKGNSEGVRACVNSDREHGLSAAKKREIINYTCHAGLDSVIVPIIINNEFIGALAIGAILLNRPCKKEFDSIYSRIKYLNIDKEKLRKAYFNRLVISEEKLKSHINFIKLMVNYIIEIEDKILLLEESIENSTVRFAKMFIKENYSKPITLREIADSVFLSPSYFERCFKKETGLTPLEYLTNLRISKAKALLTKNNKILKVCYEVGYKSLSYFNKIFKKHTGFNPKEYQNSKIKPLRAR